jgi:sulfite dehydrogenase (cytochrome) subunit B
MKKTIIILILALAVGFAYAQDPGKKEITIPIIKYDLKQGQGKDKVETLCNICHSVDYILMQPKSSKAQWSASVTKMRKVFGAPIGDADAAVIIQYLADQYGNGQ